MGYNWLCCCRAYSICCSTTKKGCKDGEHRSLLFLLELLNVELKLLAFEDVAIKTARLSGAGADACKQVVGVELVSELRIQLGLFLSVLQDSLHVA